MLLLLLVRSAFTHSLLMKEGGDDLLPLLLLLLVRAHANDVLDLTPLPSSRPYNICVVQLLLLLAVSKDTYVHT